MKINRSYLVLSVCDDPLHYPVDLARFVDGFDLTRVILVPDLLADLAVNLATPHALCFPNRVKDCVDMSSGVADLRRRDIAQRFVAARVATDIVPAGGAAPKTLVAQVWAVRVNVDSGTEYGLHVRTTPAAPDARTAHFLIQFHMRQRHSPTNKISTRPSISSRYLTPA